MLRVRQRSEPARLLDDRDRAAALALCDTDPVANVFVASRIRAFGARARPSRCPDLGLRAGRPAHLAVLLRREPGPGAGHPGGRRRVRRPRAAPGAPLLLARRAVRRRGAAVGAAAPVLGAGPRRAGSAAADGDRRSAGGSGRSRSQARTFRRDRHSAARLDSHVHRGSRRLPAGGRRRCRLPGAGQRAGPGGPRVRADRGRPGASSRPRSAPPPRRRARSRASGSARSSAARAWPRPAWPPWSTRPAGRSRRSCRSTSTTSTPRPRRLPPRRLP